MDGAAHRPLYHFSPSGDWMNDPNGLVYRDGTYHLFYQAGEQRRRWDHAVSGDLATWTERGTAIPDDGVQAFSGGAVVDAEGTAGFGDGAVVATYTGHHDDGVEDQRVAYSTDGRTLRRYGDNPVIDSDVGDFRDPYPLAYRDGRWRLVVARVEGTADRPAGVEIYESADLLEWTYLSTYESGGESWECPALYELPVAGGDGSRWVMTVSVEWGSVEHHVGRFDGKRFVADQVVPADHGFDCYAAQPWANAPGEGAVLVAWMNDWAYARDLSAAGWPGAATVPRRVSLAATDDGVELRQRPVAAVESLRRPIATLSGATVEPGRDALAGAGVDGAALDLEATLDPGTADRVALAVRGSGDEETVVAYDADDRRLQVDRRRSGAAVFGDDHGTAGGPLAPLSDGTVQLRVLVDRCSVEVFANGGRHASTALVFPDPASTGVSLTAEGGAAELVDFAAHELAPGEGE